MLKDFRHVLRHETQEDHSRIDAALSASDVSCQEGLGEFLRIHLTCFEVMQRAATQDSRAERSLQTMCSAIKRDLSVLMQIRRPPQTEALGPTDPLALDYLIEGSRLGTIVLRRRWDCTDDPVVRAADSYFSIQPEAGRWREVCKDLSAIPSDSPRAAAMIRDTKDLFGLFWNVSRHDQSKTETEETPTNEYS